MKNETGEAQRTRSQTSYESMLDRATRVDDPAQRIFSFGRGLSFFSATHFLIQNKSI